MLGGEAFMDVTEDDATEYCESMQTRAQADLDACKSAIEEIEERQKVGWTRCPRRQRKRNHAVRAGPQGRALRALRLEHKSRGEVRGLTWVSASKRRPLQSRFPILKNCGL